MHVCQAVCVCVCVCERERDYIFQLLVFCKCCTFWCLDDRARGLPYKALWLPHANSDALCFPWWVWTKPKLDTVWLWMERYYLSLTVLYVGVLYPCHLASKCATNIYKKTKQVKCVDWLSLWNKCFCYYTQSKVPKTGTVGYWYWISG